ncbi:hypothetical protein HER10_EVM0007009 [Colletotrichum scovillei]|uniref:Alpha beta hydrolase fold family n=1 Tax=Colletotrichum scovillei TaxID=1209932 RepID=A0A9P7QSE2_9PEZI|nr:uncharacterized protein HER10_EVM0007009 [Colletotrichum scovillei]KAF4778563.1 hypothetical protein HER10_EVM0007009 [Colletotrichum scovillei]KAG7038516.1 Alpha beta hydrolase fold family [Colletotrichum scovillei]KAG7040695.1 Alpha beta hydrolase fold family [Colletotrichum scovillei]KAG7060739.1 Alpha beta hydrolase fold family [Colletotrichum scovillei]
MTSWKLTAALALVGFRAVGARDCTFDSITPSQDLVWCPCEGQFFCAKLDVPLDYKNPSLGRASVPLLKIPAAAESPDGPYRGAILINPGGPGASGIELARYNGTTVQAAAGSNFDIIGFDPRGVGISEPRPNCSAGISIGKNGTLSGRDAPRVVDGYYQQFIDFGKELGEKCQAQAGADTEAGPHMTTAVTARDMLSIVEAFSASPDGNRTVLDSSKLNYYGVSYGTMLGQTFASMFPDRVGHVAIDGLVDPISYQTNFTSSSINHVDGVLGAFFVYCHAAGPDLCSFYTGNTPKDIFSRWNASFTQLDAQKAEEEGWANATDIGLALVTFKVSVLSAVVQPLAQFGRISDVFVALEKAISLNSVAVWTEQTNAIYGDPNLGGYVYPEQTLGVLCSDQSNTWYGKSLADIKPLLDGLKDTSIVGEVWSRAMLACLDWPIRSNDVFKGPYGGNTSYPMLFASNTYDPTTPIENAISNAPKYTNARRLVTDGMGHTTVATNNMCAFAAIRSYFQDTMCGKEHYCPLELGPFNVHLNGTIKENLEAAGLSNLRSLY